jgi:hypothetical protein
MIAALGGDVWAAVQACADGKEVPDEPGNATLMQSDQVSQEGGSSDALELVG